MIYKCLSDIADGFDTFLFDAWGVFNFGFISQSAIGEMANLVAHGKSVSILSNSPQTIEETRNMYEKYGMRPGVHYQHIFVPGQMMYEQFKAGQAPVSGSKFYVAWKTGDPTMNPLYKIADYQEVDSLADADFVYIDIPLIDGKTLISDPTQLQHVIDQLIYANRPVVCANPDLTFVLNGAEYICNGYPCKVLEKNGIPVFYYGKPYQPIYEWAIRTLGNPNKNRTLMIGDTFETDILGGTNADIKTCLTLAGGVSAYHMNQQGIEMTLGDIKLAGLAVGARVDFVIDQVPHGNL